jgi:hypothetical protein
VLGVLGVLAEVLLATPVVVQDRKQLTIRNWCIIILLKRIASGLSFL